MDLNAIELAQPLWLWGLLAIPVIWLVFLLFYRPLQSSKRLEMMIDRHLLPYLLANEKPETKSSWKFSLFSWSLIWGCAMLALAGPRWSYRDVDMVSKDQSLVILLDLSESMDAADTKPSRLVRAKQKIDDLLQSSQGVKIGLIAFAADPHMIAPLTDDKETIRHMLPSLGTDLVYIQGSRLSPALKMASRMLEAEPGHQQALVIISDGGFEDNSAISEVKKMAEKGIVVHAMGVGTVEGTVLHDSKGNVIKKNGKAILSKLEREPLQEISKAGQGFYIEPRYSSRDETAILDKLQTNAETIRAGKKMRLWDEAFFYFLIPVLPFMLYWFRRGTALTLVVFALIFPSFSLKAGIVQEYFMNTEEFGADALAKGNFEEAAQSFQDPYRKGVASYKAGQFEEAEKLFRQSTRKEVARDACYNLGNALVRQQKFEDAITAYEDVLKNWPDHQPAKENLDLVKKLLEQQKQEKQQDQQKDQEQNEDQQQSEGKQEQKDNQQDNNSGSSEKESSQEQDQQADQQEKSTEDSKERDSKQQDQQEEELNQEKSQKEKKYEGEEQADPQKCDAKNVQPQEGKSQEELDADAWLNRLTNDPKAFMKNKFYIESKNNGTKEGIDPW